MPLITQDYLQGILSYSPESGNFVWLIQYGRAHPGKIAGSVRKDGYVCIKIEGIPYKAHRLAWLYMTGEWPIGRVDHEDNCQSNNRWENLRLASHSQNMANRKLNKNNRSGFKGVSLKNGRYFAYVSKDGSRYSLGYFDDPEEAHAAYLAKAQELHGKFARSS
jgi:HNH endonuclease/AP2 domain